MMYLELMLPIIFLTAILLFTSRSKLFNSSGRSMKYSDADIFLKWMLGLEIAVVAVLLIASSMG
ncbi:hypothetical protein FO441_02880 [Salinicoccus cyprini]|uniref:Uncharacterized protein n=1 Tax=Salinicoccus cyprini TaxID=2493691 RepID=A0A558AYB3_9STAP|nr:hypothetical protein [Salinicoccus cyprini]TVT29245.1 hypothetical protein FO441_02880 [Salinicoccus cyprini]